MEKLKIDNIKQMVKVRRGKHSVKPIEIIDGITKMFPEQQKIELFARNNYAGWDNWGLEIPDKKIAIKTTEDIVKNTEEGFETVVKMGEVIGKWKHQ